MSLSLMVAFANDWSLAEDVMLKSGHHLLSLVLLELRLEKVQFPPSWPTPPTSLHLHEELILGKGQLGKEPREKYIHMQ